MDRDSGERPRGRWEEVARLFVCQPRWDPLPILPHSSLPRPPYPPVPRFSRSTTPAERSAQGRRLQMCSRALLCVCVCVYVSIAVCVCVDIRAYTPVCVGGKCERARASASIYVAPMYYTLQTSPPCTRGYPMCRICS